MSDYNEQTLMEAVIKSVAATPDPRLRQIMTSLVKHLHGFVREVRPTWEELLAGIQFLTAVGQKCDDKRQEFILLSDSLGVSTLVDLINYGEVGNATESTLLGPAFVEGAPELPLGSNLAKLPSAGEGEEQGNCHEPGKTIGNVERHGELQTQFERLMQDPK